MVGGESNCRSQSQCSEKYATFIRARLRLTASIPATRKIVMWRDVERIDGGARTANHKVATGRMSMLRPGGGLRHDPTNLHSSANPHMSSIGATGNGALLPDGHPEDNIFSGHGHSLGSAFRLFKYSTPLPLYKRLPSQSIGFRHLVSSHSKAAASSAGKLSS